MENYSYLEASALILRELETALHSVNPDEVESLITASLKARKIFFVGVGRVLLSLEATAKRWAHLGLDTHVVGEITEPAITPDDLLIIGSGSGSTLFPVAMARKAKSLGATVAHIGSNPQGDVAPYVDLMLRIPVRTKAYLPDEIDSEQPMTSLFEQSLLLMGDAIAKILIERQSLDLKGLWQYHANLE